MGEEAFALSVGVFAFCFSDKNNNYVIDPMYWVLENTVNTFLLISMKLFS